MPPPCSDGGSGAQEPAGLEVDPLERTHGGPKALIELEGIDRVGVDGEMLDGVGKRLGDRFPGERIPGRGQRAPRCGRGVSHRRRGDGVARESFGGDRLRRAPGGETGSRHAARELGRMSPEPADLARTSQAKIQRGLAVDRGLVRIGRSVFFQGDRSGEGADGLRASAREPARLSFTTGHGGEQPNVAPRYLPVCEGPGDHRQLLELPADSPELLELATADAEPLGRIIVEPDEAEPDLSPPPQERSREAAEDAATERLPAGETAEEPVEKLRTGISIEVPALASGRRNEELGRDGVRYGVEHQRRRLAEDADRVNYLAALGQSPLGTGTAQPGSTLGSPGCATVCSAFRCLRVGTSWAAPSNDPAPDAQPVTGEGRRYWAWADLMRRAFETDVLACPRRGGRMQLIATIDDPAVIRKVLTHLGVPANVPAPRPPPVVDNDLGF
jgi:hypothetical protein